MLRSDIGSVREVYDNEQKEYDESASLRCDNQNTSNRMTFFIEEKLEKEKGRCMPSTVYTHAKCPWPVKELRFVGIPRHMQNYIKERLRRTKRDKGTSHDNLKSAIAAS